MSKQTIKRGDVYRVLRAGKQAAFVKVIRVRKGQQPKITYRRITRTGGRRSGESVRVRWLQWRDGGWRLPEDWKKKLAIRRDSR